MKITVICVGKLREKYLKEAAAEYIKRLSSYCRLEIRELPDEKCPENIPEADKQNLLAREGERILSAVPENSFLITLEIGGKSLSSEKLAERINSLMIGGNPDICFVIGGSLGLSGSVTGKSRLRLSLSRMTFPHQLTRVILLEQIYRSFRIIRKEPYHK